ncbi:MAG: hypothetical protein AAF466_09995 [Bacteroidota bacterium]
MSAKVIIIFGLLLSLPSYAQGEKVVISEEKKGKRLVLLAENTTQDSLDVFFMVNAEGYRRSADKPVQKTIPPKTTVPMLTLIELRNVTSSYTYELIVNKMGKETEPTGTSEIVDIENAIRGKVVIFAMPGCSKCAELANGLTERRITYRLFNINTEPLMYRQFMTFIAPELQTQTRIEFPVIWNRDHTIFSFDVLETVLSKITQ